MGSLPAERRIKADTICIIGAGPSGLAAAKYLEVERAFSRIQVYEQRSTVGGIWNYVPTSASNAPRDLSIPQTNPFSQVDEPIWEASGAEKALSVKQKGGVQFMSPMYDRLETNIPRGLMGFNELDWPSDCQLFPPHAEVLKYIERYAESVRHLIEFERQVLDIRLQPDGKWLVKTRAVTQSDPFGQPVREEVFDAIACANGHFNIPSIPSVPYITDFAAAHPGIITHSKTYRNPEDFSGQKVIVVGNSASGIDIAAQILTTCKHPLIISSRSESYLNPPSTDPTPDDGKTLQKPEISEYLPESRGVRFADGSEEHDLDAIVYCTGYFYSFPFFSQDSLPSPLINTGERVENTYEHFFYTPEPTLAFPVLGQKVIPFPVAEAQAAVLARVWSGRLGLPSRREMEEWESQRVEERGAGRGFHVHGRGEDGIYINTMAEWCSKADGEGKALGKKPPLWGEEALWARERFPAIKKAFQGFGEERRSKKTLEDVGFSFGQWKREQESSARESS